MQPYSTMVSNVVSKSRVIPAARSISKNHFMEWKGLELIQQEEISTLIVIDTEWIISFDDFFKPHDAWLCI